MNNKTLKEQIQDQILIIGQQLSTMSKCGITLAIVPEEEQMERTLLLLEQAQTLSKCTDHLIHLYSLSDNIIEPPKDLH